jgi:hypothetical protein
MVRQAARDRWRGTAETKIRFVLIENMQNVADAPPWRTFYDEINDRAGLVIRHPGYGWLGYSMGMNQLDELIPALEKIRDYRNQQRKTRN